MSITPEHVRFVNTVIRPMAERMRDVIIGLEAIGTEVDRLLPEISGENPLEVIPDGREAEGVSRLTVGDIMTLAAIRTAVLASLDLPTRAMVSKACVRPPVEHA